MMLLLKIIGAHLIGDFVLQPKSWVISKENKGIKSSRFYLHLAVHAGLLWLFLWDWKLWGLITILVFTHGIIDILKSIFQKETNKIQWFIFDQALHVTSIITIWWLWFTPEINEYFTDILTDLFWLYALALITITSVSGIAIQVLLTKWTRELKDNADASLSNAGKYIGYIERFLVFIFVVTNNWPAIGFLLTTKSIFRFGDLKEAKDRKLTEYILVGTLLSFGFAIFIGVLVQFLQQAFFN